MKEAIQFRCIARFESFEVNLRTGELLNHGERIKLPEQSFQILAMLLERPGEVLMRQEIRKRLWPNDTVVEFENSINAAIKRLRGALGDSADEPRYIETLARRGYRWKVPVEWAEPSPLQQPAPVAASMVEGPDYSASRLLGKKASHYRVLEILGGGGMGVVYKAEDIKLGRRVALKFLPEELAAGSVALERFEREARAASALNDPHICTIYEIEEYEGQPFIVMELLEGQTLRELISAAGTRHERLANNGPFVLDDLLDIATQIASGLGAAHKKGIVHRDIKPANIFVTTTGQVKILDFGLAKLQHAEAEETEPQNTDEHHPKPAWNSYVTLTRAGVTIGTAGYMSPEQIRGEKLDARTDLFSFGLVLYEMAAGQRAFTGDTAPILENAILHHEPAPVRECNRALPPKLETIINRALEKDRQKRYQNVSDMRADLERVKRETTPKGRLRKWMLAAVAIALLLIGSGVVSFLKHAPTASQGLPEVKLTQLTDNSPENPVSGGGISPDGKYLAYTDRQGMHTKLVGSDEVQSVPQPPELRNLKVIWELGPWFPDSKRFVAHSHPAPVGGDQWFSADTSNWIVSALGGAPQKLRDSAYVWSISPDGSTIAFGANFDLTATTNPGDETWLMSSDGTNARRLFPRGPVCCVHFFPDGKRISYESDDAVVTSDLSGGPVTTLFSPSEKEKIGERTWLPDGRLVYFDPCRHQDLMRSDTSCNYWITRVDTQHGGLIEKPQRLTNWVGVSASGASITLEGKRIAFRQSSSKGIGYLADLNKSGTRIIASRRFPLEEGGQDSITEWTADGKNAFVGINRFDHYSVRMQALNSDTQTLISSAAGLQLEESAVSPDGKWLILLVFPAQGEANVNTIVQLMRVPITGGTPDLVFSMREGSSMLCARPPANLCAVAEESQDRRTMIVTAFNPIKGRGSELARFDLIREKDIDPYIDHLLLCDISRDGTRLAVARGDDGPIEIHSIIGKPTFVIPGNRLHKVKVIKWAADGKGLIVSTGTSQGGEIVHLDFQGNITPLWQCTVHCIALPSPDGRHLGIYNQNVNANMWMMENF